jgi:hypothetical protein
MTRRLAPQHEERERQLRSLHAKIRFGLDSGEPIEWTPELMDEIERESEERFRRGEQPSPDVGPASVVTSPARLPAGPDRGAERPS